MRQPGGRAPTADPAALPRGGGLGLLPLVAVNALFFFDQAGVTVALPDIGRGFGIPSTTLHWVFTVYLLAVASFMPLTGPLGEHVGQKRLLLAALALFGGGAVACALAPSIWLLLAARFCQGVGGAFMVPLALAAATRTEPPDRRGWVVGVFATGGTALLVLGPLLAGALLDVAGWRWLFLSYLPVVVLVVWGVAHLQTAPSPPVHAHLDSRGAAFLLIGLTASVLGLAQLSAWAAGAVPLIVAGAAVLALFVRHELRTSAPLIPLPLLADRTVVGALTALFAIQFAVLSTVFILLYLRRGLGETGLVAGAVIGMTAVGTPLLSTVFGRLADRRGSRLLAVAGLCLAACGLVGLAIGVGQFSLGALLPGILLFSISRPAVFTPASAAVTGALPDAERALAASLLSEARQLGAVFGVAVMGLVVTGASGGRSDGGGAALAMGVQAALLVAAAVVALAAVTAWIAMPAARRGITS